jgi:hypothetical protein
LCLGEQRGPNDGLRLWSSTESGPEQAWFYNFGKNGQSFGRHEDGEKLRALSVRCVKD